MTLAKLATWTILSLCTVFALHFVLPLPISEARGSWQIKDWYTHPLATPDQLAYYRDARRDYPRLITIEPFGGGSIDGETDCAWEQELDGWLNLKDWHPVWRTTLVCDGKEPVTLAARPFSRAVSIYGIFSYYFRSNQSAINVVFESKDGTKLIDYVPAHWQRE